MKINLNGDFEVSASPEETFAFITTQIVLRRSCHTSRR